MTPDQRREAIKANIARQLEIAKRLAKTGKTRPDKREVFHPMPRIP